MKPVLVSQRVDYFQEINETRDCLDHELVKFIIHCNYLPIPVPNQLVDHLDLWVENTRCAGIVLSGGNNIGDYLSRDRTEAKLLEIAEKKEIPVVGICRGMQLIAKMYNVGTHAVERHVRTKHQINGNITRTVNSFHRLSIDSCPLGFQILATSEDNEIEAISHLSLPWEGWMWHPERNVPYSLDDIYRLKSLFS